eukprot:CAMPEP_0172313510 /NCGR_PEP_ID=MMETSP1058-20130122/20330_1 /TAXON_ID=83371 /ORGANISM="Detonula confervacea, Strain CCMP 353" /LENGTH=576 /DNA_ID=CAMNT_0013027169 /DNA_START=123 /DNA_END=1853 /DNA_ORIENTATION=-
MASSSNDQDRHSPAAASDQFRIGYMSDVEGHWDYFLESVQRSNVIDWEEADCTPPIKKKENEIKFKRLILRPNTHFIYGGDTVDKGPGDIRLVRSLVSLKKRYPERVHLLVGNRDLNKIRLPSELSESDMKRDIEDIPKPFWDRNAKSLKEYLEDVRAKEAADGISGGASLEKLNTKQQRLRYILKHTLGCPDTFEFRREEIQILTEIYGEYPPKLETHDFTPIGGFDEPSSDITDEEVVDSFLYEISDAEGSLRQYLNLSQIAAIVGNTIFVHGAIDSLTMKFVPSLGTKFEVPTLPPPPFAAPYEAIRTDGRIIENVHEWVESLNNYLKQGLKDFSHRPQWNDERTSRGGEGLLAIQNRPSMWGRSVVCNSYADGGVVSTDDAEQKRQQALLTAQEQLDPLAFEGIASNVMDPAPAQWLLKHGIQRIVVGHKPTGDCPAVLSSKYTGVEIVAVDTSFSHRKDLHESENIGMKRFGENRGEAIAMVEIAGKDALSNWLETSGVLACGTEYSNEFPILSSSDGNKEKGDHHLGRKLSNGWWVKVAVPPNYHLCRGSGRFIEYDIRSMKDVMNDLIM